MTQYLVRRKLRKRKEGTHLDITCRIDTIFKQLNEIYGATKLILKASKLEAVDLMNSTGIGERVLALQKILKEDPTINNIPDQEHIPAILNQLEDLVVEEQVKRMAEDELQRRIQRELEQKYNDYIQDIKIQILKKLNTSPENAQTLKKLGHLEKMERSGLNKSALETLRPTTLEGVIGQQNAINSLVSKLNTPYPQHILLYGPPGVGKTTCARLALAQVKGKPENSFKEDAPFIEIDGTTLRWDPRESTNPLLGSVHDPIYQGAKKGLAEEGIPEPKIGLVSQAHGGVLFIDEIGDMDPLLQNKLLKVLEDKRVFFESSYYDPNDSRVPRYIKQMFEKGVPADFILIGATTRSPEEINPAFRSRCMEIFFEPLTKDNIKSIIYNSAYKLNLEIEAGVVDIISDYTLDGRGANKILVSAYDFARNKGENEVTRRHIFEAIRDSRIYPYYRDKTYHGKEMGKIFGVGAAGYLGTLIELEAIAFPADREKEGKITFNTTAGTMTRDSVFNSASVYRKENGENLNNYDIHINVIGGGKVDGPSAGAAIYLAILGAVKKQAIWQDIAVTGEISIQGKVKPVGAIYEKVCGARLAGIRKIIIPFDNLKDIPNGNDDIEIVGIKDISEAYQHIFA